MVRLQQQTVTPFSVQQIEHMPPIRAVHKFCIMLRAIGSSQTQWTFMPPWHFSYLNVQRGTISQLGLVGETPGTPTGVCTPVTPWTPMLERSIIIVLVIPRRSFLGDWLHPPSIGGYGDVGDYRQSSLPIATILPGQSEEKFTRMGPVGRHGSCGASITRQRHSRSAGTSPLVEGPTEDCSDDAKPIPPAPAATARPVT